jgi:hypothetical protein
MNKPKSKSNIELVIEGLERQTGKSWSQIVAEKDCPDALGEDVIQNIWSNIPWKRVEVYVFKYNRPFIKRQVVVILN